MGGKKKCSVLSRSPSTVIVKNNNCFIFSVHSDVNSVNNTQQHNSQFKQLIFIAFNLVDYGNENFFVVTGSQEVSSRWNDL